MQNEETQMNADTFKAAALAAAPQMPGPVRGYLTHTVNNLLCAIQGYSELAEKAETLFAARLHAGAAVKACLKMKEDLKPFLGEVRR